LTFSGFSYVVSRDRIEEGELRWLPLFSLIEDVHRGISFKNIVPSDNLRGLTPGVRLRYNRVELREGKI